MTKYLTSMTRLGHSCFLASQKSMWAPYYLIVYDKSFEELILRQNTSRALQSFLEFSTLDYKLKNNKYICTF